MKNIAKTIAASYDTISEALFAECEAAATDINQDWRGESTTSVQRKPNEHQNNQRIYRGRLA